MKIAFRFLLLASFLLLLSSPTIAQDAAPNGLEVPWYSQKITGCPYTHCSLASMLMVMDYHKGLLADKSRKENEVEAKLVEYQRQYFMKNHPNLKRRTKLSQGSYYVHELDSLIQHYEDFLPLEYGVKKDYGRVMEALNEGYPVMINVSHRGATSGLIPGRHRHWIVLRGMTATHVWTNDPGRAWDRKELADNKKYPIKKEPGNPSYFDGCWTGRYIIVKPKEQKGETKAYQLTSFIPPLTFNSKKESIVNSTPQDATVLN